MADRNMKADMNVQFTEASSRQSLESGESVKTLFGKIRKWLSDLKPIAFSGSYNDLSNKPTTGVSGVKGNAETTYRTGNVNLTPANIGLGNVNNTSDADKPISTAAQTALNNKVSKTGDTMSGRLTHNGAGTVLKNTNLDINGDNPASNTWSNAPLEYHDKDNARMGYVNTQRKTDGSTMLEIGVQARNTDDTADIYNTIDMIVGRGGARSYGVSDPTAFRKAIGTGNQVTLTGAVTGTGTFDSNGNVASVSTTLKPELSGQINYNTNSGVKNQLITDSKSGTATVYGITITSNNDGTFTINGTNSNSGSTMFAPNLSDLNLLGSTTQITPKTLKSNKVKFYVIGLPRTVQVQLAKSTSVSVAGITLNVVQGSAISDVVDITNYNYVWFRLVANANASFDNVVIKPMVVDASVEDTSDFVPYSEPNYRLTQKVNRALEQTGYNLLEITTSTQTINGVTFTVDKAAGTIIANGTATAVTYYNIPVPSNIYGNVCLSGCPNGGSDTTYDIFPKDRTTDARPTKWDGITAAASIYSENQYAEVKYIKNHSNCIQIRIRSGVTVSALVFKPMIVPAELAGVSFQPYAKSNAELTSGKLDATGNESIPYDDSPDYFGLRTAHPSNYDTTLFIKMKSGFLPKDTFLLLGNDDNMLYFGIEKDNFVVQTKDANSYYEFKDDGIYLNGTNVLTGEFRGKDLTNVYTIDQMYSMIHSGKFDDLFLGDYFTKSMTTDIYTRFTGASFASGTVYYEMGGTITNRTWTATTDTTPQTGKVYATKTTKTENVTLMFAAFDYYYNVGSPELTTHHAVLIPRSYGFATTAKMNSSNTTVGSYFNSDMHQIVLPCYAKALKTVLNNHLLAHSTILPNAINASTPSMAGAGATGASNAWAWETVELQLMSEPQIYGTTVWSSSAYDVGADYKKLPVFDFINGVQFGSRAYWLRSVVSSTSFAHCSYNGVANGGGASTAFCVRPLILFG